MPKITQGVKKSHLKDSATIHIGNDANKFIY